MTFQHERSPHDWVAIGCFGVLRVILRHSRGGRTKFVANMDLQRRKTLSRLEEDKGYMEIPGVCWQLSSICHPILS